jgi:aryl-alcohol dehydrogenase-like predicted oxidoreductase
MLEKRRLGRTGLEVSVLSLGGLFISSFGTDRVSAAQVIKRAWELGINYIDTAAGYRDSELVIGSALRDFDGEFIISTKVGYQPEPFKPRDREFLRQAVQRSLDRLQRDSVDILMIHEPDRPDYFDWWEDRDNYTGPVLDVINEAREEGKTRFLGLGGTTAYELPPVIDTGRFDVVLTAFQYNLLWREAEHEVLPAVKRHDMGLICGSPLHQGALARIYENDVIKNPAKWLNPPRRKQFAALYEYVNDLKLELPELALRFLLSNPDVATVLCGIRSLEELEKNVETMHKGPLPSDMLEMIDKIAKMVSFRPYLEPYGLPFKS